MIVKKPKLVFGFSVVMVLCGIILIWMDSPQSIAARVDGIVMHYGIIGMGAWFGYHSANAIIKGKEGQFETANACDPEK